jgi:hypothetical protein
MAKPKQKEVKTPKKRSTKYSKLAAVCSKELTAKKTALVRAEKAFAKAQKTHTELLAEVARLDMLDRSLKALINGTEPPQNVRYVYNYPQWVWYGNPYGWYWQQPQTYCYNANTNFQGGQFTTTNAINTVSTPATYTSGALSVSSGTSSIDCSSSSGLSGLSLTNCSLSNAGSLSLNSSAPSSFTMTTTNGPSSSIGQPELTVDLSTGATEDEPKTEESTDISACMNVKVVG